MIIRKTSLLAAAGIVSVLAATPGYAATNQPPTANMPAKSSMKIDADKLIGEDIKNQTGDSIGTIESVIIDNNGQVAAVVVGVGGFLGIGDREVAIDWNQLSVEDGGDVVRANLTKNELKAMPAYDYKDSSAKSSSFVDMDYLKTRAKGFGKDAEAFAKDTKKMASDTAKKVTGAMKVDWVTAHELRASKLIGAEVVNKQGDTIGEVEDLVVNSGKATLVLSTDAVFGFGGDRVSLDLDNTAVYRQRDDVDDLRVEVAMSEAQIKALPKYITNH